MQGLVALSKNRVLLCLIISWQWRKHADAAFKCVQTLFVLCARFQLGIHDLELRFANKSATSLPEYDETEYSGCVWVEELVVVL